LLGLEILVARGRTSGEDVAVFAVRANALARPGAVELGAAHEASAPPGDVMAGNGSVGEVAWHGREYISRRRCVKRRKAPPRERRLGEPLGSCPVTIMEESDIDGIVKEYGA